MMENGHNRVYTHKLGADKMVTSCAKTITGAEKLTYYSTGIWYITTKRGTYIGNYRIAFEV